MKTLKTPISHEAEFGETIPWESGVDLSRNLLPVDESGLFIQGLSEDEKHAFSWVLGLLASSAIKEHEKVLFSLRSVAYPEKGIEGSQFFLEEGLHSAAFQKFLDASAQELNLTPEELSEFLPKFKKNSLITRLYALEARLGGRAIWWTVAATEEESIRLFQKLRPHEASTDPVFFELNHAHFLEESRHSSFSYKMLRKPGGKIAKASFAFSRILQTIWLLSELKSFRKVRLLRHRHPMLEHMARLSEKIDSLSFLKKLRLVFQDISYTRMLTHPETHPRLMRAVEKEGVFFVRLPEAQ